MVVCNGVKRLATVRKLRINELKFTTHNCCQPVNGRRILRLFSYIYLSERYQNPCT